MAQLALTAAASIGRSLASTAASYAAGIAERLIFGPKKRKIVGPRLESFQVQASTEGAPVPRIYGRHRLAGEVIWAANFKETVSTSSETAGKGGRLGTKTTTTEYLYSISLAIGLCEGVIDRIGRVWADGKPFDLSAHQFRVHRGEETQAPDTVIEALEGAGRAPAFRGLAYIAFEDLPLKDFGNRIPQFSFEIEKSLRETDADALENALTAVVMIPGSGEFVYGTTRVLREIAEGRTVSENAHNNDGVTDFAASLDALLAAAPNLEAVSLVVSWFGTDLRAGTCALKPGVETATKTTTPYEWRAGGVDRAGAHRVSLNAGAPAYGGTPSDRSVVEAIATLKARGLEVALHPFILMDIPSGNGLPDPGGAGEQPAYPWRGRICVGANDKTAAAGADIAHFFGTASPAHFAVSGDEVTYSGPAEWSFRRFVLHYARLASLAGGVDRFLLGSELRGVTTARASASAFPAIAAMRALCADVRVLLGPATKLSYAADWSEYFGHQPTDGSGDVFFHLDPLWADAEIDFIGIDNYLPLADWRYGLAHLDAVAGFKGPHDRRYLKASIEAGERYDYYYASPEDRAAQIRSPVADGAYGEPYVFRPKDFRGWWASPHHDRPGGVRQPSPTAWVPQSKPIVFTETGCPAVDRGANEPNVFVDPKSSESRLPAFSSGVRDDLGSRRYVEATLAYWRDPATNPVSAVYGGPMIESERSFVYAYDARPFPFFPGLGEVWGDAPNWALGHWLNGRLGRAPLDLLVTALCEGTGLAIDASGLAGTVGGYALDRPLSPREAIDPLADIFQFDAVETAQGLRFQPRATAPRIGFAMGDLAARDQKSEEGGVLSVTLGQASDLPVALRLGFIDEAGDYAPAMVEARLPVADHAREIALEAPIVFTQTDALARARAMLAAAEATRATAAFALPPSAAAIEPGDVIVLDGAPWRVAEISDGPERRIEAVRAFFSAEDAPPGAAPFKPPLLAPRYGPPLFELLDLPRIGESAAEGGTGTALLAAFCDPWPGGVALYRDGPTGPDFAALAGARAGIGRLVEALAAFAGAPPSGRFVDQAIRVQMTFGAFSSRSEAEVLAGANALGLEGAGGWEALQFQNAALQPDGTWILSRLLRAQGGTEDRAGGGAAAGARIVVLNAALAEARYPLDLRGLTLDWRAGPERDRPEAATFSSKALALTARNLMPLAPVHLRAARAAGGVRLSWIRRTRGVESFDTEAPLGETFERYRVALFQSASAPASLRTIEVFGPFAPDASGAGDPYGRPNVLYTDAMILADFGPGGAPQGASFEVAQLSETIGPGRAARKGFHA